jgi:hypothetical protein
VDRVIAEDDRHGRSPAEILNCATSPKPSHTLSTPSAENLPLAFERSTPFLRS